MRSREQTGEAKSWTRFKSWYDFKEKLQGPPNVKRNLALPYQFVRLLIGFLFELIGKLLI